MAKRKTPAGRRHGAKDNEQLTFRFQRGGPGARWRGAPSPRRQSTGIEKPPSRKEPSSAEAESAGPSDRGGELIELPKVRGGDSHRAAEAMAKQQREISVSEFFAKNRHLLGFDNKRKALLTTVKEAVDNSLDACEEAGILPELFVRIRQLEEERFEVTVRDNGPGIVKHQIPNIFGKLLYGSKFHRLKMSRGQQGIGISAAGMYGLLTTGKAIQIVSRTGSDHPAHRYLSLIHI